MQCSVKQNGFVLARQIEPAITFAARLKGLMFRRELLPQTGLLLCPCPQIHTCFMRFAIDVVFVDKQDKVVDVLENFKPWRMSKFYPTARRTLELPAGTLQGNVHPGDELIFN